MKTLKRLVLMTLFIFVIVTYIGITDFEVSKDESDEIVFSAKSKITLRQCKEAGEKIGNFFKYVSEKCKEVYSTL